MSQPQHIVWMDLEMTGLNPETDTIIEVATLITNYQLEIIEEGPEYVIHQPAERFEKMDSWNRNQHTRSGLWERVLNSTCDLATAEKGTLDFIKKYVAKDKGVLAGNSIWQDRRFLIKYMTLIDKYLHYRMIDVSTVKTLAQYWYGRMDHKKKNNHRALDDIRESVAELKYYREQVFIKSPQS